jgi:hypothetical protein
MKQVHVFDHSLYHQSLQQQIGHGMPVFLGSRQKGGGLGSILGFIGKYAIPLLNQYIIPHAATAVMDTLSDVSKGAPVKDSMKKAGIQMLKNVGRSVLNPQQGHGLKPRRKRNHCSQPLPTQQPTKKIRLSKPNKTRQLQTKRDIFG